MWPENRVSELLRVDYPIIQAGMAGGPTTPELVAAVSNAGGLGTLGAGYMEPEAIRDAVRRVGRLTERPFGVNLFIPERIHVDREKIDGTNKRLDHYRQELHINRPEKVNTKGPPFDRQLDVIIEEEVPVFSCTFGVPSETTMEKLKRAGVTVIGTATTVREGAMLEESGVDVIVGQGSEAGGHRGTFLGSFETGLIGTMALIPQLVDHVEVPVVAAGGIMDGRGAAAALALGAEGIQMGTAFLTCEESGTHMKHREAVLKSQDDSTVVTPVFSGKPARGIHNRFISEMARYAGDLPDYPIHNSLTKDIRGAAKEQNEPQYMSLWAGQASALSRRQPAAELVHAVADGIEQVISKFPK